MRPYLYASLTMVLGLAPMVPCVLAEDPAPADAPAPLAAEPAVIDGIATPLPVFSKKEITIPPRKIADLAHIELWYRSYDGKAWGAWAKHGITFDAGNPVVWSPAEGIWQIYLRPILTSGLAEAEPQGEPKNPKLTTSFIIDRTPPTVSIEFPQPKAMLRGGDHYTLKWTASDPYLRAAPVTLLYSRDGDKWDVIAANIPNKGSYDWLTPIDMTVTGQVKVEVTDKADNVGSAVNTGLLIDSIKPSGSVVGPPITNTLTTTLQLNIKDGGPAGLESAQLWVSQDDGTSWTEGPWIRNPAQVDWKAPGDGKYRLAIVAKDRAGNTSAVPKGKSADQTTLIVDTTPPLVQLSAAIGIIPANAAQGANRRAFKPGDRVQVQFLVKDINPAPNSAAVYLETAPGKWQQLTSGQPLDQAFRFEIPEIATKDARIKVTAADLAGNIGEATAAESFEIQTAIHVDDDGINLKP